MSLFLSPENRIKLDLFTDHFLPIVSNLSNVVNIAQKILIDLGKIQASSNHYYEYLKDKRYVRCILLIALPIASNVIFYIYDRFSVTLPDRRSERVRLEAATRPEESEVSESDGESQVSESDEESEVSEPEEESEVSESDEESEVSEPEEEVTIPDISLSYGIVNAGTKTITLTKSFPNFFEFKDCVEDAMTTMPKQSYVNYEGPNGSYYTYRDGAGYINTIIINPTQTPSPIVKNMFQEVTSQYQVVTLNYPPIP